MKITVTISSAEAGIELSTATLDPKAKRKPRYRKATGTKAKLKAKRARKYYIENKGEIKTKAKTYRTKNKKAINKRRQFLADLPEQKLRARPKAQASEGYIE